MSAGEGGAGTIAPYQSRVQTEMLDSTRQAFIAYAGVLNALCIQCVVGGIFVVPGPQKHIE